MPAALDSIPPSIRRNAGPIIAVIIGLLLISFAGFEDVSRPYEITQLIVGGALILGGCVGPGLARSSTAMADECEDEFGMLRLELDEARKRIDVLETDATDAIDRVADEVAQLRGRL